MVCTPRTHFTGAELEELNAEYAEACRAGGLTFAGRIPDEALGLDAAWSWNPVAEEHVDSLRVVMDNHPTLVLSSRAYAILNGDTRVARRAGQLAWELFTLGTECECCLGWRLAVFGWLAVGAGFLLAKVV